MRAVHFYAITPKVVGVIIQCYISSGEALALKEDFKRLTSELTSLRHLLSNGSSSVGPNGLLVPALREGMMEEVITKGSKCMPYECMYPN